MLIQCYFLRFDHVHIETQWFDAEFSPVCNHFVSTRCSTSSTVLAAAAAGATQWVAN